MLEYSLICVAPRPAALSITGSNSAEPSATEKVFWSPLNTTRWGQPPNLSWQGSKATVAAPLASTQVAAAQDAREAMALAMALRSYWDNSAALAASTFWLPPDNN